MKKIFLTLLLSFPAFAQYKLQTVKVFGGAEHKASLSTIMPVSIKTSIELQTEGKTSIGDAVSSLPGVTSTGFSISSTRPVIRGLKGERIRILVDEVGSLDVSGTSDDHVIPINPLLVDSIEIVRGPLSLLYGSSAIGGVVNIVSSRRSHELLKGLTGSLSSQVQTVNNLKNVSTKVDYGLSNWILHFDGNYAHNQNLKVPTQEKKIKNSQGEQSSFNFGSTYIYNKNHASLSYTNYNNTYGVVAEEDVIIETKQERIDFYTSNKLTGPIKELTSKTAVSFYKHSELESGSVGTTFKKTGFENRIDLNQKEFGRFSGQLGLHSRYTDLKVSGNEAFIPSTNDLNIGLFSVQEFKKTNKLTFSLGNRFEFVKISPLGIDDKNYLLLNASIGALYQINQNHGFSVNVSYNQRNPNSQELFANGAHIALGIFESGDTSLEKETAKGVDLAYMYKTSKTNASVNIFLNKFNNYIDLLNSNTQDDTDESGVAGDSTEDFYIYNYAATSALLYGAEASIKTQVFKKNSAEFQADLLIGRNLDQNTYLSKLTPPRLSLKIEHRFKGFSAHIQARHRLKPLNLGVNEPSTKAYTLVNVGASKEIHSRDKTFRVYALIKNIFDVEARNHSSFTKDIMQTGSLNAILGVELLF